MKNNLIDKFINTINYDTYQNILDAIIVANMATCITENTIKKFQFSSPFLPIQIVSEGIWLYCFFNPEKKYMTKNVVEINVLYQEFIDNYNKLNKVFELKNPVEIFAMFNFLYSNGYLSQNKSFEAGQIGVKDIEPIMGTNIFMGKGICRHLSSMFSDILNGYNIQASKLTCYIYTGDGLNKFVEKITGNHVICLAQKDNINYFLDTMNQCTFKMHDNILYDEDEFKVDIKKKKSLCKNMGYDSFKDIYTKGSISRPEEKKLIFNVVKKCRDNIDILDGFYNENKVIYEDVSNKLKRIKRR